MNKIKHISGVIITAIVFGVMTHFAAAQTATPVPVVLPTEVLTVTNADGYRTHTMPDIGTVEYPLAFYSVWNGVPGGTSRDNEIFFPGVITIRPNDSVIYGVQFDTAYQIRIAMSEATGELDSSMLGSGPLMQYEADAFDAGDVMQISLNDIPALRIDNLPVGPMGMVTSHIVAIVDARMIEILVEPVAEVGGTAINGLEIVDQIIGSIVLEHYQ